MCAQSDTQYLERDEFYLALRLIALSQNNLEVSEEVIRINHPIPPLPKIDLKSGQNNNQNITLENSTNISNPLNTNFSVGVASNPETDIFSLSEEDENKYTALFNRNKDLPEKISLKKLNEMFISAKIQPQIITKIFNIINFSDQNAINLSEFKVVFKLIYKSYDIKDVPLILPNSLKFVLIHGETRQKNKEIDFMQGSSTNMRNRSSQKITHIQENDKAQNNIQQNPYQQGKIIVNY